MNGLRPGAVVALWRDGDLAFAVVSREEGSRVRIVLPNGRTEKVQASRIVLEVSAPGTPPGDDRDALQAAGERAAAVARRIRQTAQEIEVPLLWEIATEQAGEKGGEIDLTELAELAVESRAADDRAAVMLALREDGIHFVRRGARWEARGRESVEDLLHQRRQRIERETEKRTFFDTLRTLGTDGEWRPTGSALEQRYLDALEQVAVFEDGAPEAARAAATEAVDAWGVGHDRLHEGAFRVLRRVGRFDSDDENLQLRRYALRTEFPEEVLEHAAALAEGGFSREGRVDLSDLEPLSIDSPRTLEIDDALSIEPQFSGWTVGVHIADPAALVEPGDPVDREAAARSITHYMPSGKILMLPRALAEGAASLVVGLDRPTLSFLIDLDEAGEIVGYRIERSIVRTHSRLDYAEVDATLEAGMGERRETLQRLDAMAQARQAARLRRGGIVIEAPEAEVFVEPTGRVVLERMPASSLSRRIVSESMILAGEVAARFCEERQIPAIHRRQAPPTTPLADAGQPLVDPLAIRRARRSLRRADVGLDPGPHFALGLPAYAQVTSPLRRFQDLATSRQIAATLAGQAPCYDRKAMQRVAGTTDQAEADARRAERAAEDYWMLRYLQGFEGRDVEALVVDEQPRPVVQLSETLWEQAAPSLSGTPAGTRLTLRVQRVNPRAGLLVLRRPG